MPYRYADSWGLTGWVTTPDNVSGSSVRVESSFDPPSCWDNYYTDSVTVGDNGSCYGDGWSVSPANEWNINVTVKEEVRKEMRGLYRVLAVDYKNDDVVVDKEVISKDAETARLKALAHVVDKYDLDDLDIKAIKVMDVRKVQEPQKVQVVK